MDQQTPTRADQAMRLLHFAKEEVLNQGKPITIEKSNSDLLQKLLVPSFEYLQGLFEELEEKDLIRGDVMSGGDRIEDVSLSIGGDRFLRSC